MKYIESRSEYFRKLNEALLPSQFRKYVNKFDKDRYSDIFKKIGDDFDHDKNYYRVYIPLEKIKQVGYISDTQKKIDDFLKSNGASIIDYIKGSAKFNDSKNETSIGKILNRLKNEELNKKFISDEKRKAMTSADTEDLMVVISRHPYDIAGSDTDRDWTNCMTIGTEKSNRLTRLMAELSQLKDNEGTGEKIKTLQDKIKSYKKNGENVKYLIHEVEQGSLISYLIKKSDRNINKPLGVLNIKPYSSKSNQKILQSSITMYGNSRPEFKKTVNLILEKYFNNESQSDIFKLNSKVYNDEVNSKVIRFNPDASVSEKMELLKTAGFIYNNDGKQVEWSESSNGRVNVNASVKLEYMELDRLPVAFGTVTGDFFCGHNQLTTLEGAPIEVTGNFSCYDNKLTTLEGAPRKVGGYFSCNHNKLITLEGAPIELEWNFVCGNNQLTTLEGAPRKVGGSFLCENNQLTTLEGGPITVGGTFACYNNQLTTLEGAPTEVGKYFSCYSNKLTTLKGAPIEIKESFWCSDNQLTTLEGAPVEVGGSFWCENNQLTTLEGAPVEVGGDFRCYNNQLTTLESLPKKITGEVYSDLTKLPSAPWLYKKNF